jgi:uncharacterized membrane protein YhhN
MIALSVAVAVLVGIDLWSERRDSRLHFVAKPLASAGFVAVAVIAGAGDSGFGRLILAALLASWCGDVFLLGRARRWFLLGLGSFLAAHLLFTAAFVVLGLSGRGAIAAAGVMAGFGAAVAAWLRPHVAGGMRAPVAAYVVAISVMVVAAAGAAAATGRWWFLAAAVAFTISDLGVARDRFVAPGFMNRAVGLPLYYAAQLVFAWQAFA